MTGRSLDLILYLALQFGQFSNQLCRGGVVAADCRLRVLCNGDHLSLVGLDLLEELFKLGF